MKGCFVMLVRLLPGGCFKDTVGWGAKGSSHVLDVVTVVCFVVGYALNGAADGREPDPVEGDRRLEQ